MDCEREQQEDDMYMARTLLRGDFHQLISLHQRCQDVEKVAISPHNVQEFC